MPSAEEQALVARLKRVQDECFDDAGLDRYGAFGTAIGPRIVASDQGRRRETCLRVFVTTKGLDEASSQFLRREHEFVLANGERVTVGVDVCLLGADRPQFLDVSEPIIGEGLSDPSLRPGTVGGWAWDCVHNSLVMLSNAHVLGWDADSRPVTQGNVIIGTTRRGRRNETIDAAIADPLRVEAFNPEAGNRGLGIFRIDKPRLGMSVSKFGTSTGLTFGIIDAIRYRYRDTETRRRISGHFAVRSADPGKEWSEPGDSGALVCLHGNDDDRLMPVVVGVHWAGHGGPWGNVGLACNIRHVFRQLQLDTLSERPFAAFLEPLFDRTAEPVVLDFFAVENGDRAAFRRRPVRAAWLIGALAEFPDAREFTWLIRDHRLPLLRALALNRELRSSVAHALFPLLTGQNSPTEVLERPLERGEAVRLAQVLRALAAELRITTALEPMLRGLDDADGRPLYATLFPAPVRRPMPYK